jgi:hypothetical protein
VGNLLSGLPGLLMPGHKTTTAADTQGQKSVDNRKSAIYCAGMNQMPTPQDIEQEAQAAKISIAALCREVGIDPSTFFRWRSGSSGISIETVRKMVDVLERESATGKPPA